MLKPVPSTKRQTGKADDQNDPNFIPADIMHYELQKILEEVTQHSQEESPSRCSQKIKQGEAERLNPTRPDYERGNGPKTIEKLEAEC